MRINSQKNIQADSNTFQRNWLGQRLIKTLTCGFVRYLTRGCTLYSPRSAEKNRPTSVRAWGTVVLMLAINVISVQSAGALQKESLIQWKIYALNKLGSWDEFSCLNYLYVKESNWNPKAKNGSHYGIPQGRSKYLSTVGAYKQIDWGIKYIDNRYNGDACLAMKHFNDKGWH
jgi:hypothetical protein